MKTYRITLLFVIIVSILITQADVAWSGPTIDLSVKTILASQKPGRNDPSIKNFTNGVKDVFGYSPTSF